jgi:hypothetical protein
VILFPSESDQLWLEVSQFRLAFDNKRYIKGDYHLDRIFRGVDYRDRFPLTVDLLVTDLLGLPTTYIDQEFFESSLGGYPGARTDYHVNSDYSLCLCIPELASRFMKRGYNLVDYFRNLIDPFLVWITYYRQYHKKPWPDSAHGILGYLEAQNDGSLPRTVVEQHLDLSIPYSLGLKP